MLSTINTMGEYLELHGNALARKCQESMDPLHQPGKHPEHEGIKDLLRKPFPAQAALITGTVKHLEREDGGILACSMRTGKTLMSMAAVHLHAKGKPYRALVMCPGHLPKKWKREIEQTLPGATATVITSWKSVIGLQDAPPPSGPEWFVIGKDKAKLSSGWRQATVKRRTCYKGKKVELLSCPSCGQQPKIKDEPISLEKLGKNKVFCKCGSALWCSIPKPRRFAPSEFIKKKLNGFFDYFIADEIHLMKSASTAQGVSFGSLATACKKTLVLTGTLMGGKANDIRPILFRLSPDTVINHGYEWGKPMPFVQSYGRIDEITKEKEYANNKQSKGSSSTRKVDRPGIMPTLFGDHLADKAVFLSLDDMVKDLPPYREMVLPVEMDPTLRDAYKEVEDKVVAAVTQMIAKGDMRLLGQMVETLLHYPDYPSNWKPIGYMEQSNFITVCIPQSLSEDVERNKELVLLEAIAKEKKEKRQCWVYATRTRSQERIVRLLGEHGHKVKWLKASIDPIDREDWIAKNGPGTDVMVSNPSLVETGLDLFGGNKYNFSSIFWYGTGYYLPTVMQASVRAMHLMQTKECRTVFMYYPGTMQERAIALMGKKKKHAESINGVFSEEGLVLADIEEDPALALAKSLNQALDHSSARSWARYNPRGEHIPAPKRVVAISPAVQERILRLRKLWSETLSV